MKKAFALHKLQVPRPKGGGFDTHPVGSVLDLDDRLFADFKARGAVREPNERELARYELTRPRDPLDHDGDGRKGGSAAPIDAPALVAKHKGGGKWAVVNRDDEIVSGDDLFDSREAAEEWIAAQAASLQPAIED